MGGSRMTEGPQHTRDGPATSRGTQARVWVLDDPRAGTSAQALGIAERLGVAFRRIPLHWNWMAHLAGLAPHGSLRGVAPHEGGLFDIKSGEAAPKLVISSGSRSTAVALWLKARFGCRLVHCMRPGLGMVWHQTEFDLLVVPEHDGVPPGANIFPVTGAPHRVSPRVLEQAAERWADRLDHLSHPRVALLVGGSVRGADMEPAVAHGLARATAALVAGRGGSVLATTSRRTGAEASDALAAGLGPVMHLLYRWGEPGENPYLGYLATADAIVVTADSVSMLSEACATALPVYVALPDLAGARHRRLVRALVNQGQVRRFDRDLGGWPRPRLDEAGRVADEIRTRYGIT